MGTTHADYFLGDVPVTRPLRPAEVEQDYEFNTGGVIVETFTEQRLSPDTMPAVLVAHHGPFVWGADAFEAIEHAEALEYIARLEWRVRTLDTDSPRPDPCLVDKHHARKHGPTAYYGQGKESKERSRERSKERSKER